MVLVEACGNGLPAIASNIGSLAEVLDHGKTAILCEPNNADALAASVRRFFTDGEEMQAMSAAARRLYEERYTPERNIAALEEIYRETLEAAQARQSSSP